MESDSIEATLHYQMAYRVQNHALDISMPNDSHDALLIVADYHNQKAPTCIHIPRQIPRAELLKLLPERWVTNYEQIKKQTAPVAPIQSTSPTFIRNREGSVTIKFDRSQEKEPATPPIFPTMFMVQPVPKRRKPDSLNKIIHSFDGQGNPTFHFRDPQSQHCYWDIGRCLANCDCDDYEEPDYFRQKSKTSCQKRRNLPGSDNDSDSEDDTSCRRPVTNKMVKDLPLYQRYR
ncbi:hypothetical protein MLD38_019244 [Melastoma candidum]|uniref:Uncharacterized protein n=1 Tax=Melastoma candidum TaxID=119954 RepID=A0ACB9QXI7_9MYRT|nr:hypothetical protein MLD38_019244 [Melastoma candidum]